MRCSHTVVIPPSARDARYDDPRNVDNVARTVDKVESIKLIMQDNIEQVLSNTVQLDHINETAEGLSDQANVFKRRAGDLRKKMWWKKLKMTLLLVFVVLAIIAAIAIPLAIYFQGSNETKKAVSGDDGGGGGGGGGGDDGADDGDDGSDAAGDNDGT